MTNLVVKIGKVEIGRADLPGDIYPGSPLEPMHDVELQLDPNKLCEALGKFFSQANEGAN